MVALGGQVFEEPDDYVRDLAGRLFSAGPEDMSDLAQRVRFLRNPALLGEVGRGRGGLLARRPTWRGPRRHCEHG